MKRTIIYVVGKGRSGSTLLDDLLGSIPGVASLGELRQLWSRGFTPGYRCACGEPVADCPVWSVAVTAAVGDTATGPVARAAELEARVQSWRHLPRGFLVPSAEDREFGAMMSRLYDAVADALGVEVLVDSSKWPLPAGRAGLTPGWDARVLHLVRDPRAVAHSYRRRKGGDGQPELPRFGALHTAVSWSARNAVAELARRSVQPGDFMRIRYEDLAGAPRETVRAVGDWIGRPRSDAGFVDDVTIELDTAHLVGGNPRRLERGPVVVQPDDEWIDQGTSAVEVVTGAVTYPLRRRYGYAGRGAA